MGKDISRSRVGYLRNVVKPGEWPLPTSFPQSQVTGRAVKISSLLKYEIKLVGPRANYGLWVKLTRIPGLALWVSHPVLTNINVITGCLERSSSFVSLARVRGREEIRNGAAHVVRHNP